MAFIQRSIVPPRLHDAERFYDWFLADPSRAASEIKERQLGSVLGVWEVLLTTGICQILFQIFFAVVTCYAALSHQFAKRKPAHFRKLRFPES